jgi:hypothetical protein
MVFRAIGRLEVSGRGSVAAARLSLSQAGLMGGADALGGVLAGRLRVEEWRSG